MDRIRNVTELSFTDDASLCEYYGIPVGVFEGDVRNIKLTYDFELETLRQIVTDHRKAKPCVQEPVTTSIV
jgi:2-C-methyl-D-erythritol 4-phosphate cytidylyltransferase